MGKAAVTVAAAAGAGWDTARPTALSRHCRAAGRRTAALSRGDLKQFLFVNSSEMTTLRRGIGGIQSPFFVRLYRMTRSVSKVTQATLVSRFETFRIASFKV
jgi:hypothetical protein